MNLTLCTRSGAPLCTSRGAPILWPWLLPLPLNPAPLAPTGTSPSTTTSGWPRALLTTSGVPLRTGRGALLLWGQVPLPAQVPILPDPQATKVAQPRALCTSRGALLYTSLGAPLLPGFLPLPAYKFLLTGVTRDLNGAALGNCAVALYLTRNDALVDRTTSDANGNYTFTTAGPAETYYVVAYLAGSPDRAGTTINTLTGA